MTKIKLMTGMALAPLLLTVGCAGFFAAAGTGCSTVHQVGTLVTDIKPLGQDLVADTRMVIGSVNSTNYQAASTGQRIGIIAKDVVGFSGALLSDAMSLGGLIGPPVPAPAPVVTVIPPPPVVVIPRAENTVAIGRAD